VLTGPLADVTVLTAFGVYTPERFSHTALAVIVDARGQLVRLNGLTTPAENLARQALDLLPAETAGGSGR